MLLCEQCFYDLTMYIGQSEITALEAVGQLRVVDAKQVQDCCVQIVDMNLLLDSPETEFVCRANGLTTFDSAASHPNAKTIGTVVSTV